LIDVCLASIREHLMKHNVEFYIVKKQHLISSIAKSDHPATKTKHLTPRRLRLPYSEPIYGLEVGTASEYRNA
jgi:hypothetical protein